MSDNKNWFKTLLAKYNQLCDELGVDNGACRSCVPIVKFDPEEEQENSAQKQAKSSQEQ